MYNHKNQTKAFLLESERYVGNYLNDEARIDIFFNKNIKSREVNSILDVGCGNGEFLNEWKNYYKINNAVGVEPSRKSVLKIREKWKKDKNMKFETAFAHKLPFDNDSFDIVVINSVLHWIGRNEYLQSLGELIRVCKKYLYVMDFVALCDYRVNYSHRENLFTYKQDFEVPINLSGIMETIEKKMWYVDSVSKRICKINEEDLKPFKNNFISYHARKGVLFKKNYNLLPLCNENEFLTK